MNENLYDVFELNADNGSKPASAVDVVIGYVRSQILHRKWRIGDKLPPEGELCELLNVGRGSVREAIKRLEAIQLLDIRRGDGTYISPLQEVTTFDTLLYKITLQDINFQQILDYRIQLELSVMQLAIRNCKPEVLEELHANCNAFESYIDNQTETKIPAVLHDLDMQFHHLLGKAANNQLLSDVYTASLRLFSPYILRNYQQGQVHESPRETVNNHKLLLNAIETHDSAAATFAVINSTNLWHKWVRSSKE